MSLPYRERSFLTLNSDGYSRITYSDWGDPSHRIVVCVHGLAGNGHDFDILANELVKHKYRVINVDMPGRGRSDFLKNPRDYCYRQYVKDLTALFAHIGVTKPNSIDFIGTSMGGLLGLRLAALNNSPISRIILNDIGPDVPSEAIEYIHERLKLPYFFHSVLQLEKHMKDTRGPFWGPITDEQWSYWAEHNALALPDGRLTYNFDTNITSVFRTEPIGETDLWACWEAIKIPALILRGKQSLVFTKDTAVKMREIAHGKPVSMHEFEDCGHAPSLMAYNQIDTLISWFNETSDLVPMDKSIYRNINDEG